MLQYLQAHSRPVITYTTSQCARFVHSPRRIHEEALELIGRYLKHTTDQGLILRPTEALDVDWYVDVTLMPTLQAYGLTKTKQTQPVLLFV